MTSLKWQVGEVQIFQIVETEAGEVIQNIIPNAISSAIRKLPELTPDFASGNGRLNAVVQCFLVKLRGKNILIDTCNGNFKRRPDFPEWGGTRTNFLERFRETGIEVSQVDIVICTHLHFDHVGWNTFLKDGNWVPTFPRAKYLFVQEEFDYWSQEPRDQIASDLEAFQDSVMPIVDAGLATLVDSNYILNENIHFIPTHGHTPGHICVNIESQGKRAIVIGDLIFHPCQIINPSWVTHSDQDPAKSSEARIKILNEVADTNTILLGAHFAKPVAVNIIRAPNGFNFRRA